MPGWLAGLEGDCCHSLPHTHPGRHPQCPPYFISMFLSEVLGMGFELLVCVLRAPQTMSSESCQVRALLQF